jgi:predicted  nucleic acid-binding Zn-ribbon protein
MPTIEPLAGLRQRLEQLHELEDKQAQRSKSRRSTLNTEALMESLRANLPLGVLSHHDRLRSRGRRSIAEVRNGVCSGCHMTLSTGLQAELQRATTLLKCETCGRFIFPTAAIESSPASASRPRKRTKK